MPTLPSPAARNAIASALYLMLCLVTLGHALFDAPADLRLLGMALFLYLALELAAASRLIVAFAAVLIVLGLMVGEGAAFTLLLDAALRTLPFLVLFFAVLFLQGPALESPTLRAIGNCVAAQPAGRRFAGFAVAGHLLGATLNVVGLVLVLSLRDPGLPARDQVRLSAAAMRGFGAAHVWSPLFVAMSVVLAALPALQWSQIVWRGLFVSLGILALAWVWNRIERETVEDQGDGDWADGDRAGADRAAGDGASQLRPAILLRAAGVLLALLLPVILLFEGYGLSIPIALGLVAPPVALLWRAAQAPAARRLSALGGYGRRVFTALPGLRNETLLFFAANVFGVGLSTALDAGSFAPLLGALPAPALMIPILIVLGMVLAGLGVHPLIYIVAVGNLLSPEALRLSQVEVALCLLVVWSLGVIMSPFSGIVLQVSRLTSTSPFVVAWRWNAPFCLAAALPASALVYVVGWLF